MNTRQQTIAAGAFLEDNAVGDFFRLLSTAGPVTVTFYRNGAEVSSAENMEAGYSEQFEAGQGFDRIRIASATTQAVKWVARQGSRVEYDRLVGSVSQIGGTCTNTAKTVTNASAQLLAANAARRYLLIQNKDATGNVWVSFGSGNATQANGVKIIPGGNFEMNAYCSTDEIRAIGDIASNANVVTVEG